MTRRPTPRPAPGDSYVETDRQAAEWVALANMLDISRDCFSLSVIVCNHPALRDYMLDRVRESVPQARVVAVPAGTVDVFETVDREAGPSPCPALFVVDLEKSIPSEREGQPALRALNASRELWQRRFPCPVLFWLPEYAATLVARHAPDFWRYRSHRFEFISEQADAVSAMAGGFDSDIGVAANLSVDEKHFRIAELESRIDDAGENPPKMLARHVAVWLNELGVLHKVLGDLDRAEQMHCKALGIAEKLGWREGMANQYGNLGLIYRARGDLDRAEQMQRKSLDFNEKLGRREGMANAYVNLGLIYRARGDLDRAEQMLRKALDIEEKLGRREGMAAEYGNLGLIYRARGDLDRAEQMHRKALDINEKLGRREGMANQYGNLGVIYRARGDLDRAEQMHRKALDIEEKIGRREGMANQYGNLGVIYQTRGDLDRAEQMYRKALDINEKLGRREGMAIQYGNLGVIAKQRGDIAKARKLWTDALAIFQRMGAADQIEWVQGLLDDLPPSGA